MLARRFTIVCFMTMLFAMGFARLVAQSSDNPAEWRGSAPMSCTIGGCTAGPGELAWLR